VRDSLQRIFDLVKASLWGKDGGLGPLSVVGSYDVEPAILLENRISVTYLRSVWEGTRVGEGIEREAGGGAVGFVVDMEAPGTA
jgi:hypothetical protein